MDQSLYERQSLSRQSQSSGFCFGRITRVFPEERMCEVKTFMGRGLQEDNSIPKCQWLNMDAHPDGDESTNIPRVNSYGLVFFVDGTPFIFGFFSPMTLAGSASVDTDDKEQLNEGDRIYKTVGRNKIIMRAHGEIEIQSTDTCRTIYFPDRNIINTLCRNYEFRTDGGTQDWINIEESGNTVSSTEYRTDINRTSVIIEERGYVDGEIISRTSIGAGTDSGVDQPVWTHTVKRTGETEFFVRAPGAPSGHKVTIKPDGTTKLEIAGKTTLEIAASGDTTLDVGTGSAVLKIGADGAASLTTKSTVGVTAKGAVSVTSDAAVSVTAKGNVDIKCAKASIKADSNKMVGGAVTDNPINNDPITGIPLQGVGGVDLT